MKKLTIGVLAHVDAGKTTLSEGILYKTGMIREMGRVDNGNAHLDTDAQERARGITIFSRQAVFSLGDKEITLLDTPGHVDFSAEMERTLQVLDYAILVISGADGVQGHTRTLWRLLNQYHVPVFLFINKMDQQGTDKGKLMEELQSNLSSGCIDFATFGQKDFYEAVAMEDEDLLDFFIEHEMIKMQDLLNMISARKIFPCFFGSALKIQGIDEFLKGLEEFTQVPKYLDDFGARVFKITRDEQGNRLTHLKVTGGNFSVKDRLSDDEKVNQIRVYSGDKYETVKEAPAGIVCAVTGLSKTRPGQGLGMEQDGIEPFLEPVLTYQMILPEECSPTVLLPKLYELEEEEPQLHIIWKEELQEIQVQLMGKVQIEILKNIIQERFGVSVEFGTGNIVYRETIQDKVEGVGHFEPLRHYAEVHLILEPLKRGSGMRFETACSEDVLDKNWQRLVMTHLLEREHKGVLTGSSITDIKITLVSGRAHQKHTEGGDFRQATYRAVRQGLRQAQSILLEPYYEFRLEVPQNCIGRAMTDLEKMHGTFEPPQTEGNLCLFTGKVPASCVQDYQMEVIAYTKGAGRFSISFGGYEPCHNAQEIIEEKGYDPDRDTENPCDSVFCSHGAGFLVPWDQVKDYMHIESVLEKERLQDEEEVIHSSVYEEEQWMDAEEVDQILNQTYYANQSRKNKWKKKKKSQIIEDYKSSAVSSIKRDPSKKYLLVDGYNIIYAWEDLKELSDANMDAARGKLMDVLCNYQGIKKCELIVVFDAYRVKGHETEVMNYHNIHVVYTKEAETADQYIEKFAHEHGRKYDVTVATSDGLEQIIIRGQGCRLLSAREFQKEIEEESKKLKEEYLLKKKHQKNYLMDELSEEVKNKILKCTKDT